MILDPDGFIIMTLAGFTLKILKVMEIGIGRIRKVGYGRKKIFIPIFLATTLMTGYFLIQKNPKHIISKVKYGKIGMNLNWKFSPKKKN